MIPCVFCDVHFSLEEIRAMGSGVKVLPDESGLICTGCLDDPCVGTGNFYYNLVMSRMGERP